MVKDCYILPSIDYEFKIGGEVRFLIGSLSFTVSNFAWFKSFAFQRGRYPLPIVAAPLPLPLPTAGGEPRMSVSSVSLLAGADDGRVIAGFWIAAIRQAMRV